MLFTIDREQITRIPHRDDYVRWRQGLTDEEYIQIMEALEKKFNEKELQVSSFIPGSDWDYPYYYIYKACDEHYDNAALFFGLLVWEAAMRHPQNWAFIKNGPDSALSIRGTTYFRID